jgi:parallel beta-helix repeat protein
MTITATGGGVKRSTVFSLSVTLALTVATPIITPNGGTFSTSVSVALQSATSGASIFYTTDGSTPTQTSTLYAGAMTLTSNTTVKAAAFKTGYNPSPIAAATFTNSVTSTTGTGKTYYVGTNGSDSNSCTQAQNTSTPKRTILSGLSCLTAGNGDVVDIRSGTYSDVIRFVVSGTSYTNAATIRAHAGETVTLTGGIALEGPSYVIFDRLTVSNCQIWVGSTNADGSNAGHHIRFLNMDVTHNNGVAVMVNPWGHHVEFIGGNYHDVPHDASGCTSVDFVSTCYAFYIAGSDNLFEHLKLYNNGSYAMHIYSGYPQKPNRNIIRFNEFYNNGSSLSGVSAALLLGSGDGNIAYGNIVRDNNRSGILSSNGATNSKIYNNTVFNNNLSQRDYGGIVWGSGSGTIIKNNIVFNNGVAEFADSSGVQTPTFNNNFCSKAGSGCALSGSPLFIDQSNADFRLQAGSPAVDNGQTLTDVPPYDLYNTPKPKGNSWDIGAIESW